MQPAAANTIAKRSHRQRMGLPGCITRRILYPSPSAGRGQPKLGCKSEADRAHADVRRVFHRPAGVPIATLGLSLASTETPRSAAFERASHTHRTGGAGIGIFDLSYHRAVAAGR